MIDVSPDRFEQLVEEALDEIPGELARFMENVAVVIEDRAHPDFDPGGGQVLLGLYQGVSLTRRSPVSYFGAMPDRITIFREPHRWLANSEDGLRALVRRTVIHEVGHHFGISDARLHELGW